MNNSIHFGRHTDYETRRAHERQAEIDAHKAAFFARGGKVQKLETGVTGLDRMALTKSGNRFKLTNAKGRNGVTVL